MSARRSHALVAFAAASILALAACSDQAPLAPSTNVSRAQASPSALARVGSNRRIIALHDGRPVAAVITRIRELGGTVTRAHEGSGLIIASGLTDAAAQSLAQHADVSEVFRDRVVQWLPPKVMRSGAVTAAGHQLTGAPDDQSGAFFFPRFQWNMRVTRASDVWKLNDAHGEGTTVCDLDSGIDPTHIDLVGKVDLDISTSMVATEPDILDYNGHGTFVSSQITTNGLGMASVAPLATLCQVKVLDKTGAGLLSDAIAGIVYAADAKADVINMSFGAYFTTKDPDFRFVVHVFQRAVNYASSKGVTLVASAGNGDENGVGIDLATDAPGMLQLPAQLSNVISVGATAPHAQQPGTFDNLASYSNYGYPGVDVVAPGGDLTAGGAIEDLIIGACSSYSDAECADHVSYSLGAGTSFAAPLVSGEAAVLESDATGTRKNMDSCIMRSADPLGGQAPNRVFGFGRIDVLNAIHCGSLN